MRCSAATRRSGRSLAALLFGALLNGTSVRNLDPAIFEPQLATNLTYIIQGLIVLFVSAPVLVTTVPRGRGGASTDAQAGQERPAERDHGLRPRGAAAGARRPRPARCASALARVPRAQWFGWAGVALGLIAFYLVAAAGADPHARALDPDRAARADARRDRVAGGREAARLGRHRRVPGRIAGAYGAVSSGVDNLERVFVWSALVAAMLRYATPLIFAALGGVTSASARAWSTSASRA